MIRPLHDGLILRTLSEGVISDRENLPSFIETGFVGFGADFAAMLNAWQRNLIDGHPTTTLDDIFIVVDPAKDDQIVAATTLIPQTWQYAGIPIPAGRPELVATHADYRRRGLIREIFSAIHARSAERGHLLQFISGIDHFYRQFGYDYAIPLGVTLTLPIGNAPALADGETQRYTLRPASDADLPDICRWSDAYAAETLVSVSLTDMEWHHQAFRLHDNHALKSTLHVIVDEAGERVGYVRLRNAIYNGLLSVISFVVGDNTSYFDTCYDVLRELKRIAADLPEKPHLLGFWSGLHPTPDAMIGGLFSASRSNFPYTWYIRIADLPSFLQQIAPVLADRLAQSGARGYTGILKIGFYARKRLVVRFERGTLYAAEMEPDISPEAPIRLPYHTLIGLMLGYRRVSELRSAFPDVEASAKDETLLEILFPKRLSWVIPIV